jgi:site-specific DNA-methyltransferase (adenine-specific)
LICGDSVELLKKMDDESVDVVISYIPYGINYSDWDVKSDNTNSALLKSQEHSTFKTRGKTVKRLVTSR